jgi:protein-disulfide isomerase
MHDGIYENQDRLDMPLLFELGRELELPALGLRSAIENHDFAPKIRADFLGGVRSGVNGTPTFFINNVRHEGSYDFETLASAIDARLLQLRTAA